MPACAKLAVVVALFAVAAPWEEAAAQEEEPPVEVVQVDVVNPLPLPVDVVSGVDVNNVVEVTAPGGIEVTAPDGIDVSVIDAVVPVQDEWQRPYQRTQTSFLTAGTGNGSVAFSLPSGFYLVVTHVWAQTRIPATQVVTVAATSSFNGSTFIHVLGLTSINDGNPLTSTFSASLPLSVYADEDVLFLVTRQAGGVNGEVNTTVTVTGYLLPIGGTNPR